MSTETWIAYYREGRRHLARAMSVFPVLSPIDALVQAAIADAECENGRPRPDKILCPRTVRRYACDHRAILSVLARAYRLPREDLDGYVDIITQALERRRGKPPTKRTARRKVRDATEEEAERAFCELKRRAMTGRELGAVAAALLCLVVPRIGIRPKELIGAYVTGAVLTVRNAKATSRHTETRSIELAALHSSVIEATRVLCALVPPNPTTLGFERWRNSVAEHLARACAAIGQRRLSLYSFRHVAIATWERAGYSREEIAALAGHLGLDTASIHYARANSGWGLGGALARAADIKPAHAPDASPGRDAGISAGDLEIEDVPVPSSKSTSEDARRAAGTAHYHQWLEEQKRAHLELEEVIAHLQGRSTSEHDVEPTLSAESTLQGGTNLR